VPRVSPSTKGKSVKDQEQRSERSADLVDLWLESVLREARLYAGRFTHFDSLYVGGGTPSLLTAAQMQALFGGLCRCFVITPGAEVTMEVNPDDIDAEKLAVMKALGVNRLSFGVQSFNDEELRFLKRRHDAAGAQAVVAAAQDAGFANIGIDLMYGLPGQTKESWRATLERALSFAPAHISCYQLTVEGQTPLRAMIERGAVALPGEKVQADLFLFTSRMLERRGYTHYEISNFAAGDASMCRHNHKYWSHVPYLGLGPSAHSFDGAQRWWNLRSVERYCEAVAGGAPPVEDSEHLSAEQLALEHLYLGLRTREGVPVADIPARAAPIVSRLKQSRLLKEREGRLRPTRRGYLVADSLPVLLS
jgi:oxygen-independent coproporphyrinogen-3 oxidase